MSDSVQTPSAASADQRCAQSHPAIARCLQARRLAFDEYGENSLRPNEAYRAALPPLVGLENIRAYIACVAHAIAIGAVSDYDATRMLYAAQVALSADRSTSRNKPAPTATKD